MLRIESMLRALQDHWRAGVVDPENGTATAELFDTEIACAERDHETDKALNLLRHLVGEHNGSDRDLRPRLRLHPNDIQAGEQIAVRLGLEPGGYAVVAPAGTANNRLKQWRADGIAGVIAGLAGDHRLPTLLTGAVAEEAALKDVVRECRRLGVDTRAWVGGAGELPTLFGIIAGSRLAVGIDSGPMHVAAALGVPVVTSFGGGHWPRWIPVGSRVGVVTRRLPCFNCDWHCWLDQAACFVHEPDTYLNLIDWALADDGPGLEIRELEADPALERRARKAVARRSMEPA